jgi:hypothetical protein
VDNAFPSTSNLTPLSNGSNERAILSADGVKSRRFFIPQYVSKILFQDLVS